MKRILIADDHEAVRAGLRAVLQQRVDWEVVAEATDGEPDAAVDRVQPVGEEERVQRQRQCAQCLELEE